MFTIKTKTHIIENLKGWGWGGGSKTVKIDM